MQVCILYWMNEKETELVYHVFEHEIKLLFFSFWIRETAFPWSSVGISMQVLRVLYMDS